MAKHIKIIKDESELKDYTLVVDNETDQFYFAKTPWGEYCRFDKGTEAVETGIYTFDGADFGGLTTTVKINRDEMDRPFNPINWWEGGEHGGNTPGKKAIPEAFDPDDSMCKPPNHPAEIMYYPNNNEANVAEMKKANEIIEALRKRSKDKGEKNARMSQQIDILNKEWEKACREQTELIKDVERLKKDKSYLAEENSEFTQRIMEAAEVIKKLQESDEHHREQLDIANKRLEKAQDGIKSLHEQINQLRDKYDDRGAEINHMTDELTRANRIIDALTR